MMPSVSILCCTYGRSTLLVELLESFARQSYDGVLELVVINDCPLQTLVCDYPGVRIVNVDKPFLCYADKRNAGLALLTHELMCVWDDDDIYLPDFMATVVGKLEDGDKAMRLSRLMKWDGRLATVISGAQYHTAVLDTAAVRKMGGWRPCPITDADFAQRLVIYRFFHGRHQHEDDQMAPLVIYRSDPDRVHMEGGGAPRLTNAQYQDAMNRRIYAKKEPGGVVELTPAWSQDWEAFVADHLPQGATP